MDPVRWHVGRVMALGEHAAKAYMLVYSWKHCGV